MKNRIVFLALLMPLTWFFSSCKPDAPTADFYTDISSGEAPLQVQFYSTATGEIDSYSWDFGDGGTSSSTNPSHVFTQAGSYTVTLKVTGPGGSDSHNVSITVNQPRNKVAYGISSTLSKLVSAIEQYKNSDVNFVRYTDDDHWIVSFGDYSFQSYGASAMNSALSNYNSSGLSRACYVGTDKWLVAYGGTGYSSSGLPTALTNRLYPNSDANRRVDFDKNGNWIYLTNAHVYWSSGYSSSSSVVSNITSLPGVKGFAFGYSSGSISWVVYSDTDFRASSNIPSGLYSKLNELKGNGSRIVDVEIGDSGWAVVYQ